MSGSLKEAADRWVREVRKGTTRLVVLSAVAKGETYGYDLLRRMRRVSAVPHGASEATLYPLLREMEAGGFLSSRWVQEETGLPARKYYRLTRRGLELLALLKRSWSNVRREMELVMKGV